MNVHVIYLSSTRMLTRRMVMPFFLTHTKMASANTSCKYILSRWHTGLEKMLDELKKKDVKVFKSSMISYFGSRASYYRYKLGQTRIIPEQQQYILQWCKDQGYENMVFDRYTEELDY